MQENVFELINKATTNTWHEEKQAYIVLRDGARMIRSYLAYLKLKNLRLIVLNAMNKAKKFADPVANIEPQKREPSS